MFFVCPTCKTIYTGVHVCSAPDFLGLPSGNTPSPLPHPHLSPKGPPPRKAPVGLPSLLRSPNPSPLGDNSLILHQLSGGKGGIRLDQPIVGFRSWNAQSDFRYQRLSPFSPPRKVPVGIKLMSAAIGSYEWKPNEPIKAQCHGGHGRGARHSADDAPVKDCSCGLYAYRTLLNDPHHAYFGGDYQIWGAVLMWGRVFGHKNGFRSEYAQILCLASTEGAHFYAKENPIPVIPAESMYLYAREFGIVMEQGLL